MKKNLKIYYLAVAMLLITITVGCATKIENNYLKPDDFASALKQVGLEVESIRPLPPEPFRASLGCAIKLKGVVAEIGVYKYDQTSEVQRKRLARIAEEKCTYIIGIKFPVVVHGSFMIFGLDKNTQKRKVLEAIKYFK